MQRVASLTPSRVPLARCALEKGGRRVPHSMVVDALLEQGHASQMPRDIEAHEVPLPYEEGARAI